jgi:hypothetical protein
MRKLLLLLCAVLLVVGLTTAVRADIIPILNPGFDDNSHHSLNGWALPSVAADKWTSNDFESSPDGTISPPTPPPSSPNAFNFANYVYNGTPHTDQPIYLYQVTTHPIAAGDQYMLEWQTAVRADCTWTPIDYMVGFRPEGGTVNEAEVRVVAATLTPKGTWFHEQLTWTVPDNDPGIGSNLEIYVKGIPIVTGSSWWQTSLDSFSLNYTAAPEPSTLALLAAGLVGLLAYAWRKRK